MNKNDVLEIYDENYAQEYNQRFLLNEKSKKNADFEQKVISNLLNEIGKEAKWLDVSCGTGYFLSRFPNVERAGLDISPAMLKLAKQGNPNTLFVQGDYRDKRPQWEGQWDLVSCMWWAYSYVESLSELEKVVENFASWTSEQGVCFLPICDPAELGTGELKLPYISKDMGEGGGFYQFEGVIWSWIDEESRKQHLNLLAPQLEYMLALFKKHFEQVEIIEYPLFKGSQRKAIVARSKKQKHTLEAEVVGESRSTGLFSSFSKIIRGGNWWLYKIPPLLAIAYGEIILMSLPAIQSILTISALLFSISCVAAYGHIVNDIFDIEVDQIAGKRNSIARFSSIQRILFCIAFLITGFMLPILMNFGRLPIILLAINYLLPTLYSAPPLRLKEKGIWGVISDAAGAHAIPTLFVVTTFLYLSASPQPESIILAIAATAWSFCAGIRGILLHQLWDRKNDLQTDVKTLVTESGVEKVRFWMSRIIFPLELLLLSLVILIISNSTPLILVCTIFYFLLKISFFKLDPTSTFDPAPVQKSYVVPHDFYEVGLPLILATTLSLQNKWFVILLLLQAILFYPGIEQRVKNFVQSLQSKPQNLQSLQTQLNAVQAEVTQLNSRLHQTQNYLEQLQNQLQQSQTESQFHQNQTALQYHPDNFEIHLELGKALEKEQKWDEAIAAYQRAIALNPDDSRSHKHLGDILAEQGQLNEASLCYRRALQLQPRIF
ncbi:tetratricopeptide repeat protein [Tolypothrix sp. PCC 7910]|uniref:tetratricopeptide repeat protein n=1 Tax=Tolypothrix sp. PCC 7910 TaxID=2099387 RepID=UPI0014277E38|nr:tetratricopeptide repeat protein [Tolypothrix sp. PCC 7910]QIR37177.1 tetratricopeptide repeat protein [Tolypothrix sp. PCC 7910]